MLVETLAGKGLRAAPEIRRSLGSNCRCPTKCPGGCSSDPGAGCNSAVGTVGTIASLKRPLIGLVDPQEHLRETVHLIVVTPLRKGEIKLRKSLANRSFRTYRGRPLIATGPVPN